MSAEALKQTGVDRKALPPRDFAHSFAEERTEITLEDASRAYPFWNRLDRLVSKYRLRVFEVPYNPNFLDDIPQDRYSHTRTPWGHISEQVYVVLADGRVETLPINPEYARAYRLWMSSYDDDVPSDESRAGQPLKETIKKGFVPWNEVVFLLWLSEGVRYSQYWNNYPYESWNTLEVVPVTHPVAVEVANLSRIEYSVSYEDAPNQEYSGRIMDFGDRQWRISERNYSGTTWYPLGLGPEPHLAQITQALEPVAALLGIKLTDEIIFSNNPESLLDQYAKFVGEEFVADGEAFFLGSTDKYKKNRFVRRYELPGGQRINLNY